MRKLAIIAAKGNLSKKLIECTRNPFDLLVIAIKNETESSLLDGLNHIWINLGEVGKAIEAMKSAQTQDVVFVGSLTKPDIFSLKVDTMGAKLLAKITKDKLFGDNKILTSVTEFLGQAGFNVIGVQDILKDIVVEAKNFTSVLPNEQDKADIELAIKITKQLGILDIGQAAIVQNGIVLGVEAIEGTDRLIKRCSELSNAKNYSGVLVKFSKPGQELRMDLPTIGIETIKNMHASGFKGIAIEANKSIFLDIDEVVEFANQHNMFVISTED